MQNEQVTKEALNVAGQSATLILKIASLTLGAFNNALSALFKDSGGLNNESQKSKQGEPNYKGNPNAELLFGKQGEQKVKDLVKSGETLSTTDIQAEFTREFKNIARKYGINYGIVKNNPNPHHVVFQAKDKKLLDSCLKDYRSKVKAKTAKRAASKARNQGIRKNIAGKCRVIETNLDNKLGELKDKIKKAATEAKEESEKKKEKKAEIKTKKKAEKSTANKTKKSERVGKSEKSEKSKRVEKIEKIKEKGREKTKSRKRERGAETR